MPEKVSFDERDLVILRELVLSAHRNAVAHNLGLLVPTLAKAASLLDRECSRMGIERSGMEVGEPI